MSGRTWKRRAPQISAKPTRGATSATSGDPFFLPAGAEAFKRDIKNAKVTFLDTGHFALETHCDEIAAAIRDFLPGVEPRAAHRGEALRGA
jgi:pimeloyl-ACP methyl ester carboxylesterase